jgi:site-specific DNA-methyltransferase (adenine-specific)
MKPFFKNTNFNIYNNNTFDVLDNFKNENKKFNCIFADPPYFLSNDGITCVNGKMVKVNKGDWDKTMGIEQNYQFNFDWLSKCRDLLSDNGTIWVSGTFHIIYAVAFAAQKLEMKFLNNIVWEKPNPPPNLSCRYFTHSTETILWFGKHKKSKHLFNYKTMKEINSGKQMKDVWRMTAPKKSEKSFGRHPTQKPVSLLDWIIKSSSKKGDTILDPFSGSGTTGVASILNNRKFVGIEFDKKYCQLSKKRIIDAEKSLKNRLI